MKQLPDLPTFTSLHSEKERIAWLNIYAGAYAARVSAPPVVCTDNFKGSFAVDAAPVQRKLVRDGWMNVYLRGDPYQGMVYDTSADAATVLRASCREDGRTVHVLIYEDVPCSSWSDLS